MSFRDAVDLVPDDLPDGAFWAMAHEIAGLDYGDGFDEFADDNGALLDEVPTGVTFSPLPKGAPFSRKPYLCECGKRFRSADAAAQHRRDAHGDKS